MDPNLSDWVAKIETRLQVNPHDAEGWFALARDAQNRPVDQMRQFWERAVSHFPTHPYFWMLYVEQEIKAGHYDEVDKLFSRCLHKIPSIELNRQHVRYLIQTKPPVNAQNREKVYEAYSQAIERVGLDFDAASLYLDYIRFLRESETISSYADQHKGLGVRKVFQGAVAVPLAGLEGMWKEYCNFEHDFHPQIAEKITGERSRDYNLAKKNAKILEQLMRVLRRDKLPSPPRTTEEERHQIDNWRKWIVFERSNPLLLDDPNKINKRIAYVYENCLMCMPYRIDIWLETAAHYRDTADKAAHRSDQITAREVLDAAVMCMERGIVLYPERALFYLIIADLEESRKNYERVKKTFERCLKKVQESHITLAYIHYMLFVRRSENIQAARIIFKRAREDKNITQEVFVASALMEYFSTKDKAISLKIFELGMKKFSVNVDFVVIYLDFLMLQNEQSNAKILVEKALSLDSLSVQDKLLVAGRSLDYEALLGDYSSIQRVEKSRAELLTLLQIPSTTSTVASQFVSRWDYLHLHPLNENDLRNMDYVEIRDSASLVPPSPFGLMKSSATSDIKVAASKKFSLPDLNAMIPFKPRSNNRGFSAVRGGDYVLPESLETLKRYLPPPDSFAGPFPDLDQVIRLILEEEPKSLMVLQKASEGVDAGLKTIAKIVEMAEEAETEKMRNELDPERRLSSDIYRSRLAKKMRTDAADVQMT